MLRNYLKIALRSLKNSKAYTVINIVGLTLSTASVLLLFAFITFHLGFDDFHSDEDRIYRFVTQQKRETINYVFSTPPALGQLMRTDYDYEESLARMVTTEEVQIDYGDNQKIIEEDGAAFVEPSFFEIFNFPVKEGDILNEFKQPGKAAVTESMARKYFGDKPAIGRSLKIDNSVLVTITAVLKDLPTNTFQQAQIFASYPTLENYKDLFVNPDSWGGISSELQSFVKLKDGVDQAKVEEAMAPFPVKYRPNSMNIHTYFLQPLNEIHFDPRYEGPMPKRTLWTLGVVGLFLLISACLNFINLATAQVFNRLKEVGVRKSLGSKKRQLFGQFLTETSLLALSSLICAVVVALLFLPYLNNLFDMNIGSDSILNLKVFVFSVVIFLVVTLLSGSYPGILLARFTPVMALKGKLGSVNFAGINLRKGLIVVQFVISQVLIIGMMVIIKQMHYSQTADLGFEKEAVVMVPRGAANERSDVSSFKQQLAGKAAILDVAECFAAPASGYGWGTNIIPKGEDEEADFHVSVKAGDERYLETFGIELIAGRNIRKSDTLNEFLVNETFLKKMNYTSPDQAIGQYFYISRGAAVPIVGVVKDFNTGSMHEEISAAVIGVLPNVMYNYAIKLNPQNIKGGLDEIEKVWSGLNSDGIFSYDFVDQSIREFYIREQRMLSLLQIFTGIALFIGAMGLFGLVTFMVERKTKEIGVRKILGGSLANILWIFGREFAVLLIISFAVAAPIGWYFSNEWLKDFAFPIKMGVGLFLVGFSFTIGIATVSVIVKVLKAAMVNPVKSLRSE